jgi:hypothetical protein
MSIHDGQLREMFKTMLEIAEEIKGAPEAITQIHEEKTAT